MVWNLKLWYDADPLEGDPWYDAEEGILMPAIEISARPMAATPWSIHIRPAMAAREPQRAGRRRRVGVPAVGGAGRTLHCVDAESGVGQLPPV